MEDDKDLLTVCFRCGSCQPLLQKDWKRGVDSCSSCMHPFVRCMINFDVLPLVEFTPISSLNHDQVLEMIMSSSGGKKEGEDLFSDAINMALTDTENDYSVVEANRKMLELLDRSDIFLRKCAKKKTVQYFKNMIPEIGISICHTCLQFFHEEDFEYSFLKRQCCPVCKSEVVKNVSPYIKYTIASSNRCSLSIRALIFFPWQYGHL